MLNFDPFLMSGIGAIALGTALLLIGFFGRWHQALQVRAGARVLLGFLAAFGLAVIAIGAFALTL